VGDVPELPPLDEVERRPPGRVGQALHADGDDPVVPDGGVGYSCLAEIRTVETILHGAPKTPYLNFGDKVRIEMKDGQGRSIFGAIDHEVVRA